MRDRYELGASFTAYRIGNGHRECHDVNVAFDHCARGYCGGHAANPDCRGLEGREASPISFLSPRQPSSPADPDAELDAIVRTLMPGAQDEAVIERIARAVRAAEDGQMAE